MSINYYLIFSAILFGISIAGIYINRKNIILILMCLELMLLAVNTNFIAFAYYLNDITGQIFVLFILTVAACEAAIGLAIVILLFRVSRTINIEKLDRLKG